MSVFKCQDNITHKCPSGLTIKYFIIISAFLEHNSFSTSSLDFASDVYNVFIDVVHSMVFESASRIHIFPVCIINFIIFINVLD